MVITTEHVSEMVGFSHILTNGLKFQLLRMQLCSTAEFYRPYSPSWLVIGINLSVVCAFCVRFTIFISNFNIVILFFYFFIFYFCNLILKKSL